MDHETIRYQCFWLKYDLRDLSISETEINFQVRCGTQIWKPRITTMNICRANESRQRIRSNRIGRQKNAAKRREKRFRKCFCKQVKTKLFKRSKNSHTKIFAKNEKSGKCLIEIKSIEVAKITRRVSSIYYHKPVIGQVFQSLIRLIANFIVQKNNGKMIPKPRHYAVAFTKKAGRKLLHCLMKLLQIILS